MMVNNHTPRLHLFHCTSSCLYKVVSVDMTQLRVHVKVKVRPGPDIDAVMANRQLCLQYIPSYVVAGQLKMPSLALSRITGNVQVERGSRDK